MRVCLTTTAAVLTLVALTVPAGAEEDGRASAAALSAEAADTRAGGAEAEAGADGASSDGTPLRVAGQQPPEADREVPVGDDGRVRVAPEERDQTATTSRAYSAVADAEIPGMIALRVLSGDAEAAWTPNGSTGTASSDAVAAEIGDDSLVLVLMHAEASSDGQRTLYLVRVNDTKVGEAQGSGPMTLEVPGALRVRLLATDAAGGTFSGTVLAAEQVGGDGVAAAAVRASAAGRTEPAALPAPAPDVPTEVLSRGDLPDVLPTTGGGIVRIAVVALALIALGTAMRRAVRTA